MRTYGHTHRDSQRRQIDRDYEAQQRLSPCLNGDPDVRQKRMCVCLYACTYLRVSACTYAPGYLRTSVCTCVCAYGCHWKADRGCVAEEEQREPQWIRFPCHPITLPPSPSNGVMPCSRHKSTVPAISSRHHVKVHISHRKIPPIVNSSRGGEKVWCLWKQVRCSRHKFTALPTSSHFPPKVAPRFPPHFPP